MPDRLRNKWVIFSLVATGVFMSTLDSSIVNVALPAIMKDFNAPLNTVQWIMMIYLLTVSSLLLAFGRLADIKGRRWVFCRGFFLFALGSLFCGIAGNAGWLILARSFQGVGAAMLMACSTALVVDAFPLEERGKALGMTGTIVALGLTIGPALGGMILGFFSWRVIFYINIPIGVVTTVLAFYILKNTPADVARKEPFDWAGAGIIIVCFCSFIVAISRMYEWGFTSPGIGMLMIACLLSAWLFYRRETRISHPLFYPGLLKLRLFILPSLASMVLFIGLFITIFLMPFFLVYPMGFEMDHVGYIMVTPFISLFLISPVAGALSDRMGSRFLCTLGMLILAAALYLLIRLDADAPAFAIIWRLSIVGIGAAVFTSPNNSAIMTVVPLEYRGIAAGTLASARNLGMVLGVGIAGLIFNTMFRHLTHGKTLTVYQPPMHTAFMTAFRSALFAGLIVACVGGVISYLRGPEKVRSNQGSGFEPN